MIRRLVVLAALLFGAWAAEAQSCSVSATPLSFAPYTPFSGLANDATSVVTATCTGLLFLGETYEVRLDGGQSGNILGRKMKQVPTGQELGYQVYLNAGRTTAWGDGVQGASQSGSMLLGVFSRTHVWTAYGRMPAGQQVTAGSYADAPVMTIIY